MLTRDEEADELWSGADVPDAQRGRWQEIMAYREQGPHVIDAVKRLVRQGWTPEGVVTARTDPSV